ncbi:MAG: FISUMP domain-containing protein [Bacteroidales bacterium]|jgi:uncharacterized protein (TIGR02145 family)|nr:FISUMP domain-containing protein [Bacteroidales bacterium]
MKKGINTLIILSILIITFSCENDETILPVADFTADKTTITLDQLVNFTDLSLNNPTKWTWGFSDNTSGWHQQNPSHKFDKIGVYTISLTVENNDGTDRIEKKNYITVTPEVSILTDTRDNKTYKTVKIGEQWWMAENLNYAAEESYYYNNNEKNAAIFGRLYNWPTANEVCPDGWHLPSYEEYNILLDFAKPNPEKKLIAVSDLWDDMHSEITNSYEFSALPGGQSVQGTSYDYIGFNAMFWTSSITEEFNPICHIMQCYSGSSFHSVAYQGRTTYFSVRCIKD